MHGHRSMLSLREAMKMLSVPVSLRRSYKILGVITGQGSQWARMGAELLEKSPFVARRLAELDQALAQLPPTDRPSWTLREMILADAKSSRMTEAAISQPLCTAVQVVLVDLLQLNGISVHAAVGHSSGEIGAAYCAGLVTARDAMKIAYYRGRYASLARSPNGGNGIMMAVGTTFEDAAEFCELEAFRGGIHVAARNSSSSITLSGDGDVIVEAIGVFQDEGKFARQLKVDTAYHSPSRFPMYRAISSGDAVVPRRPQYWIDNMTNPVLFAPAIAQAWSEAGPFDLMLEVGPHPVLKTPALDTLEAMIGERPPYSGLLARGKSDIAAFSKALGFIWNTLGARSVAFDDFNRTVSQSPDVRHFVIDLPKYPFDHSRQFMSLSRVSLLGRRCHDRETTEGVQWRNILDPREIPWLTGHVIQGQTIFPATGCISMAVEAINIVAAKRGIGFISIQDLRIGRALAFQDDSSVEVLLDLKLIKNTSDKVKASFACYSGAPRDPRHTMALNASGIVEIATGSLDPDMLPRTETVVYNTSDVDIDRFYNFLSRLGYNYAWPFHGTASIQRKADYATGTIVDQSGTEWEDQLIVHPGMLDTALQTTFAACCCPVTELNLSVEDGNHTFLQVEVMELVPLSPALLENDAVLYSKFDYKIANPNVELAADGHGFQSKHLEMALESERIAFFYLRNLVDSITPEERANTLPHYRPLIDWAAHVVPQVIRGEDPHIPKDAQYDTQDRHFFEEDRTDVRLLQSVGENLPQVIRDGSNIFEHMTGDGMLDNAYEEGFGLDRVNDYIAEMVGQISHRYPRMNILEIGAGTGGSTRSILRLLGPAFSTYTYTDVSGGFFSAAEDRFKDFAHKMVFKTFDMTQAPGTQGFVENSYDLVIASNVLHATLDLEQMMKNARSFLKPGGFIIIFELSAMTVYVLGFPWAVCLDGG
ncbi:hypothetical protein F4860DRAFT_528733 [Xylaria cubensis]|nr:hypothetical protein F4860DRAFT_528733 [Xylaria cubensis]